MKKAEYLLSIVKGRRSIRSFKPDTVKNKKRAKSPVKNT